MRQCYYWPSMFKDAYKWVANCDKCKMFTSKPQLGTLPLRLVLTKGPFQQWSLDFIGTINPPSSQGHLFILTSIEFD